MPTIEDLAKAEYMSKWKAVNHLLLIGHTKTGKTDYVIQAAADGWTVLYIDRDNGLTTILDRTQSLPEAKRRIHYLAPSNLLEFVEGLLTRPVLRYNISRQEILQAGKVSPDDRVMELVPSKIPTNVIVAIDSWTALSTAAIRWAAEKNGIALLGIEKFGREIYGPANHKLTTIGGLMQTSSMNLIVQAHPGYYERKEKAPGIVRDSSKEADMIIKETLEVPQSSSLPHGMSLGKYFNQIGWMVVDRFDKRVLDFKVRSGRIGGGTPGGIDDPRGPYSWNSLFGPLPTADVPLESWLREMSGSEYEAKRQTNLAAAPKLGTPKPAGQSTPNAAQPVTQSKRLNPLAAITAKKG